MAVRSITVPFSPEPLPRSTTPLAVMLMVDADR
jgi:hypothetical protein